MPEGALRGDRAVLVRLSAALASRDDDALEGALQAALREAGPRETEEALLQAHLFVGFPLALEALARCRQLSGGPPPPPAGEPPELWEGRGVEVCSRVYGSNYAKLRRNVQSIHPDLDHWMVVGGYGRVIGRPALDLATRELCIAALLAVWDAPRQLHSHLRGALNAGAHPDEVAEALRIAGEFMDAGAAADVRALWERVGGWGASSG